MRQHLLRLAAAGRTLGTSALIARPCRIAVPPGRWLSRRPPCAAIGHHHGVRALATGTAADVSDTVRRMEQVDPDDLVKMMPKDARQKLYHALLANDHDDELSEDAAPHPHEISAAPPITKSQYIKLVIRTGAPFVVFGFIDNALMITAGETIDSTLGERFGMSTMMAAAFGNMVSDIVGTSGGGFIQAMADKLRLPNPHLSPAQHHKREVKVIKNLACVVGIAFGCLLGMFPLFFLHD